MVGKTIKNEKEKEELIKKKVGNEKALLLEFKYNEDKEMYYIADAKILNNKRGKPKKLIIIMDNNFIDIIDFIEDNDKIYDIVISIKQGYTGEFYTNSKDVIETIKKVSLRLAEYLEAQYNKYLLE